jgi:O-Antigen ligase
MAAALARRIVPSGPGRRIVAVFAAATALGLVRTINQPSATVSLHGTSVSVVPGDLAYLALAIALVVLARGPLLAAVSRNRLLVTVMALFSLWLLATAAHNGLSPLVSGVRVVEPAVIGLAALVLLDSEDRLAAVVDLLLAVTLAADVMGVYDYIAQGGGRVDAFLGTHDFSALATMPLLVVLAGLFAPGRWDLRTRWVAGIAGWLGLTLTAALASLVSLFLGVIVLFALAWRHRRLARRPVVLTLLIVAAVVVSTLSLRHNDLGFIYKFAGKKEASKGQFESSWSQRLIYVYVGGRIFLDEPLTGTGWWGDPPPSTFAKYVPAARRKFPDNPLRYFPPTDRAFIPQQTYDEVLYELGLVGAVLLLAAFVVAGRSALRGPLRAARGTALDYVPALWFAGLLGALAGEGLFGGIPLTTLLWLTLGVATYRSATAAT